MLAYVRLTAEADSGKASRSHTIAILLYAPFVEADSGKASRSHTIAILLYAPLVEADSGKASRLPLKINNLKQS